MTESGNQPPFVHLHLHSQYSLLDGAIRLGPLFEKCKEHGMPAVAVTDHGVMHGMIDFYEMGRKTGVKPVLGMEAYMAPRKLTDKTPLDTNLHHLVLLAENNTGYTNLCKLASIAQLDGFYYKPRIDKEVLEAHAEGVIALSACLQGEIPKLLLAKKMTEADDLARYFVNLFGEDNFYLEVQHNGIPEQEVVNRELLEMSRRLSIPMVATNDCHYLNHEDSRAHEVLLCIQTGKTINDAKRFKFGTDQLYVKSPREMIDTLGMYPQSIENTVSIAERCDVTFDFKTYHFPRFEAGSGETVDEIFEREVYKGYEKRMAVIRKKNPDVDESVYKKRLEYEVGVIEQMGFPGYFLIVADFIRYGKENGVPVGPGRGSAAGSIVAYSMAITDLDPIEHGLIFERFLNPSRISMPDIDVDFCINGREKVFKYVVERYGGRDYVAQIITYGSLKPRAVVRDVGRALDIPLSEVDVIAKMIPEGIKSLAKAMEEEPELDALIKGRSDYRDLMEISQVLEGLPRHASTHAAGVVVSDKPLVEYLPVYKGKNDEVVTQFDMKRVEQIGLVKFDFLGLRNLTVIQDALRMIELQGQTPPDLINIDFGDTDTYDLLCRGDTTGVFQLESSGMKDLLMRLRPECFDDITALVALYRPGPLDSGMVDDYVERKHGREPVEYLVPELEPLLKDTYGVILYQEQVMKIAGALANYTMAEADGLRKAMGKKIAAIMAEHRELFMKGSIENNIPEDKAKSIFDLMEKFGGYGFNKSHSAAYALIAYQTAYLKAHYPVEFIAALMTSEMSSVDGVVKYMIECKEHGIPVLPPDINESHTIFTVVDGKIRFGLVAIKNVGEGPIEAIIEARNEGGRFTSLYDFCERVSLRKINRRVIESLIVSGAFDSTNANRNQMLAAVEEAIDYGNRVQKERDDPQMGLFDMGDSEHARINMPKLPDLEEWDIKYKLELEKESLGIYVSGHPLDKYQEIIGKFTNADTVSMQEMPTGTGVRICGIVQTNKVIRTKKGQPMSFAEVTDTHGSVEVVVFPSVFERVRDLLEQDDPLLIQGELQVNDNGAKVLAEEIIPADKADDVWTASVHVHVNAETATAEVIPQLKQIFTTHSGGCQTYLHVRMPEKAETVVLLADTWRINYSERLMREVSALLGGNCVETRCASVQLAPKKNGFKRKPNGNGQARQMA